MVLHAQRVGEWKLHRWGAPRRLSAADTGSALIAMLVLVVVAAAALTLTLLTHRLDQNARDASARALTGALNSAVGSEASSAYSTGRWDDAVLNLYGALDANWAQANVSGTDITYITDDRGNSLFARRSSGAVDPPLREVAPVALDALLKRLPRSADTARKMTGGIGLIGRYKGKPALFGAMPILPLQRQELLPHGGLRYLIYVDVIDKEVLTRWAKNYGLARLHFGRANDPAWMEMPIRENGRGIIASLSWAPERPGLQALREIRPVLVGVGLLLISLALGLAILLRRQTARLIGTNEEQRRLAAEADQLREQAEGALEDARRARSAAEQAMERERVERDRRSAALSAAARETGTALRVSLAAMIKDLAALADKLDASADHSVGAVRAQAAHAAEAGRRTAGAALSLGEIVTAAQSLAEAAGAIRAQAGRAHDAVEVAAARSDHAAEANHDLLRHVDTVGSTASEIAALAEQTNLLALNAAIEAARSAGENRGFVAVANEVKALAHSTRSSTAMIEQRIAEIVTAARASVRAGEAIETQLGEVEAAAAMVAGAAVQQETASASIQARVSDLRETAYGVEAAVSAIARSFDGLADNAELVRSVSHQVRDRVNEIEQALDRTVKSLLAA